MRLFIAVPVPADLHAHCLRLQRQFEGIKPATEFHITLQFLGDDVEDTMSIIDRLSTVRFTPFEVELGDALPFPNPHHPHGVWIECRPSPGLLGLAEDIRNAMAELGYTNDHPFRAHITLGRYKKPPRRPPKTIKGEPYRFTGDRFLLIASVLTPEGPEYRTVATFLNND